MPSGGVHPIAYVLGITVQALRDLVYRQHGPVPTRVGRRVLFAESDLRNRVIAHRAPFAHHSAAGLIDSSSVSTEINVRRHRGRPTVAERQAALMAKEKEAPR